MGFLKKSKVPGELPDLAVKDPGNTFASAAPVVTDTPKPIAPQAPITPTTSQTIPIVTPATATPLVEAPKPIVSPPILTTTQIAQPQTHTTEIEGKEYVEVETPTTLMTQREEIKKQIDQHLDNDEESFFDGILDDINGEIQDLGKLEEWYKNKFQPQDVVSNMRLYWEDNKADMIIRSFGSEYKQKINEHIKKLQELEADWRDIYFKLIKKEEDMKKEERILKETLSDFVDLCKRRKADGEKEKTETD